MGYLAAVVGLAGGGKTTTVEGVKRVLVSHGLRTAVIHDRKTGAESLAIDDLIQSSRLTPEARLYLFLAARRQIIDRFVSPSLRENDVTIMDRYYPDTIAYQAYGEGLDLDTVQALALYGIRGAIPNRIFLIDVPPEVAAHRIRERSERQRLFDDEGFSFLSRVRQGYIEQAQADRKFISIDGTDPLFDIQQCMAKFILSDLQTM